MPQTKPGAPEADRGAITLTDLHIANIARQAEWCPDQVPDLSFRGNELGGECGEAQNVIKKLERERLGWRGSRASLDDLAQELADVVICADLCAVTAGIDLAAAVVAKFNATSEKVGLTTMLSASPTQPVPGASEELRHEASFLLARLRDFQGDLHEDNARDWYGHVAPSMERLQALIACPIQGDGQPGSGGDDARLVEYLEGRLEHYIDEAQRLAWLVRSLGGDPEPQRTQNPDTADRSGEGGRDHG